MGECGREYKGGDDADGRNRGGRVTQCACDAVPPGTRAWYLRMLRDDILPRWYEHSITPGGFFKCGLARNWTPFAEQTATVVTQARIIFNFAKGYELFDDERYRSAADRGARFLIDTFSDREHGGWFWSCDPDGSITKDEKLSYGQTFMLLGLASAFRATGNALYRDAAYGTIDIIEKHFADGEGGLFSKRPANFADVSQPGRSFNPVLHYFEALLELARAENGVDADDAEARRRAVMDRARAIADFVNARLIEPGHGLVFENYTAKWEPVTDDAKETVSIGHGLEWAYFLSKAVEEGLPESYLGTVWKTLDACLDRGYDRIEGGLFSPVSLSGAIARSKKGWWEQSEFLRALVHFVCGRGRIDLAGMHDESVRFVNRHFIDHEYGGWFIKPSSGTGEGLFKGTIWKLDYHIAGMCHEALVSMP